MLSLALAAAFTILPDAIDWSKASDDLRFTLLKPVMTERDVKRLNVGKKCDVIGCGSGTDKDGNTISGCDLTYSYTLTGRKEPLSICFDMLGQTVMGKGSPDPWRDDRDRPWVGHHPR